MLVVEHVLQFFAPAGRLPDGNDQTQVLVEASDLNAVQFCRKELKNQEVEDDEMQVGDVEPDSYSFS